MDGRRFIDAMFASDKAQSITQMVMNSPNDAADFVGVLQTPSQTLFCSIIFSKFESKSRSYNLVHSA